MMPIVSRKSSTGIPLSAWTFLKTWSDRRGCCDAVCAPANATPISPTTAIPMIARIPLNVMCLSLLLPKWKNDSAIIFGFSFGASALEIILIRTWSRDDETRSQIDGHSRYRNNTRVFAGERDDLRPDFA